MNNFFIVSILIFVGIKLFVGISDFINKSVTEIDTIVLVIFSLLISYSLCQVLDMLSYITGV